MGATPLDSAVEVSRCPLCGSDGFAIAFAEPPYRVCRCNECDLVWVTPRLEEEQLVGVYAGDGYWRSESPKTMGYGDYRADEPLYLKTFRKRLGFALRDVPRGGKALDVGCAAGFCMKAMADMGFDAYGVEPSGDIARHAREVLGFETVHVGTLETSPYEPGSFDLITMWDVVEHVADPQTLLRAAKELLRPEGLLVVETQNVDSAFARALGRRWHHYKHREHIYHFNPRTIEALLSSAGFRVERLTPRYAGKYVSFDFIAERSERLHPALSALLRPITRLKSGSVYVNVMDEMIVLSRPHAGAVSSSLEADLAVG